MWQLSTFSPGRPVLDATLSPRSARSREIVPIGTAAWHDLGVSSGFVVAVAAVIVRSDGCVLAMRRSADKDAGAGLWETVSGRVMPDEPLDEAMLREIHEETGLVVRLHPRPIDAYVARRGDRPMCVIVYRADHVAGEVVRSDEHDAHGWLSAAEFRRTTTLARLADAVDRAVQCDV
jgi:8-oxo-dGTP diphosphatase